MPGLDLVPVLLVFVVVSPQGGIVGIAGGQFLIHRVRQDLVGLQRDLRLHRGRLVELTRPGFLRHHLELGHLLRQASPRFRCRELRLLLRRQAGDDVLEHRLRDFLRTDGQHHRIGGCRSGLLSPQRITLNSALLSRKGRDFINSSIAAQFEGLLITFQIPMPTPFGGSFLLDTPPDVFTPEDFTAEHRAIAKATEDFWTGEVEPNLESIQHQDFDVLKRTLRKSAELGLVGVLVPERYGGMELDLVSSMIVAEGIGRDGSYAACHGGQAGIGALPVLMFGTEQQKEKYLPRLASAELIAAYALTEAQAGSDALAARTRADLSPDGSHYVLNGQKMWITNGGIADLYTVFAKVGGEKFTAFLVERAWPGVSPGAEEKKMGLKGSSTTAVYFDNVKVPVENVLGEVGRGHIIAFNILNIGRLTLAVSAHGKCR